MPVWSQVVVARTFGSLVAACCLILNTNSETALFHPKWTTGRHSGVEDALFIAHLQSFDSVIIVEEQRLESHTGQTNDRPKFPGQSS